MNNLNRTLVAGLIYDIQSRAETLRNCDLDSAAAKGVLDDLAKSDDFKWFVQQVFRGRPERLLVIESLVGRIPGVTEVSPGPSGLGANY